MQRCLQNGCVRCGLRLAGLAPALAGLLVLLRALDVNSSDAALLPGADPGFSRAVLASLVVGTLAVLAVTWLAARREDKGPLPGKGLSVAGAVSTLGAAALMAAFSCNVGGPSAAGVIGGALAGAAGTAALVLWGRAFSRHDLPASLAWSGLDVALGATLAEAAFALPGPHMQLAVWAVCQLASFAMLGHGKGAARRGRGTKAGAAEGPAGASGRDTARARNTRAAGAKGSPARTSRPQAASGAQARTDGVRAITSNAGERAEGASPAQDVGAGADEGRPRRAARDLWMAMGGLAAFALLYGVSWGHGGASATSLPQDVATLAVLWAGAAGLAAFSSRMDNGRPFDLLYRVSVPTSLLFLLVAPLLQASGVAGAALPAALMACSSLVFCTTAWTLLACISHSEGIEADLLFSPNLALACGALLAGMLLGTFGDARLVQAVTTLAVIALLIGAIASGAIAHARPASSQGAGDEVPASVAQALAQDSKRLATEHGLSPREAEVLSYLLQGYGAPYIADALGISVSTAQTHRKRIYHKCGVARREELLDLAARRQAET